MKLFSKPIIFIILLALIVRLFTAIWSFQFRDNTDVLRYRDWGRIAYLQGFSETYTKDFLAFGTLANNQPPGSVYIISGMYRLWIENSKIILKITKAPEGSLQWVNGPLLNFYLRIPSVLSDLIIGTLIYLLIKKKSEKYALLSSSLFLFNPVVIYNSAFWGQMDAVNNLFFLLAIISLFKSKAEFVIPLYLLSLFIKLSLFPLLPIILLLVYFSSKKNTKKFFLSCALGVALILLLTLPVSLNSINFLYSFIISQGIGEMENITAFAFNFWWVIFKPQILIGSPQNLFSFSEIKLVGAPLDKTTYFNLSLFIWAIVLYLGFLLPLLGLIIKKGTKVLKPESLSILLSIAIVTMFLFLPRMHERYIYPLFPLLAIYYGLTKRVLLGYLAISFLSFLNLYIVWHPMKIPFLSYEIISNATFQWIIALVTVVITIILYLKSLRQLAKI